MGGGFAALLGSQLFLGRQRVGGVYFGIITLAVAAIPAARGHGLEQLHRRLEWSLRLRHPGAGAGTRAVRDGTPYVLTAAVCVLIYYGLRWALGSALGISCWRARLNPRRAEGVGIPLGRFQLIVFTVAGAIAGTAGALYVPVGFVSPDLSG